MKQGQVFFSLMMCCLMMALGACAAASNRKLPGTDIPVEVIAVSEHCLPAPDALTATWITSSDSLYRMLSKCTANLLGTVNKEAPTVDFGRFGVMAVEMGKKRTAGYGFDPRTVTASLQGDTAMVRVGLNRPATGAVTAQMEVSPCILIRLPIDGVRHITVVDREGVLLTRMDLP